jgi:hypothetical protein
VAFLGESLTLDRRAVSAESSWSHQVCKLLNDQYFDFTFDYVNAAQPAHSVVQMTALLNTAIAPLEPDVICVQASDLVRDAAFLARSEGIFDGVHHRHSWLAKRSPLWKKIEMNLLLLSRLPTAHGEVGKLHADACQVAAGFSDRLAILLKACDAHASVVLLIASWGMLREHQSYFRQLRAAETSVYYMPYLSIRGMLNLYASYADVVHAQAQKIGAQ